MLRASLFFVALLLGLQPASPARAQMNLDELVNRRGVYLHPQTLEAYTGEVVARWDASSVRVRGTLRNGRWNGVRESFYQDGQLETRESYRDGVPHGPFESYFRTGRPSDRGTYENGLLEGAYEAFWSRAQGDIHSAHAAGHGEAGHDMDAGDLMERGTWTEGTPCGEWYRFLPRNTQGLRTGETVSYAACPSGND